MTTETFPIKIYFKVNNILNDGSNDTLSPIVTIDVGRAQHHRSVNDRIILENFNLDNNRYDKSIHTVLPEWMGANAHGDTSAVDDIAIASFNIDLDDDLESDITMKIQLVNEDIPQHDDWGFYITDIELNEISVENLVYSAGTVDVPLCQEEDYDNDGFIHAYLIPKGLDENLQLIDGRYHYITNGDYLHMEESSYNFTFKTPLYLWLLELLLQ